MRDCVHAAAQLRTAGCTFYGPFNAGRCPGMAGLQKALGGMSSSALSAMARPAAMAAVRRTNVVS